MLSIIELVLNLLGTALAAAKANNLTQEVVQGLQAAITALEQVQGTPVTQQQLEGLRVKTSW